MRNKRMSPRLWDHGFIHLRAIKRALQLEASRLPQGPIVDIGCGSSPYRKLFGRSYVGLDAYAVHGRPDIAAVGEQLPLASRSVAAAVSTQYLEHAADPAEFLTEIARVLTPSGILLLTTHGVWPFHPDPTDYWRWTEDGLTRLVEDSGFRTVRVYRCGELYGAVLPLLGYPLLAAAAGRRSVRAASGLINVVLNSLALTLDVALRAARGRHLASPCYVVVAEAPEAS